MISKQELRKKYRSLRDQLTDDEVDKKSIDIANQLLKLEIWDKINYHLFLSIERNKEVQTQYILNILQGKDKNVVLSRSNFSDNTMKHYLLTDSTRIVVNQFGIPEPDAHGIQIEENQLDIIFIPLLICDYKGNRVGYGKGFYDRFLQKCKPDVLKIGLSFFEPINDDVDALQTDIPLDLLVTSGTIYDFRN